MELNLKPATLVKRYKRFLADIIDNQQKQSTIHCANTGAMTGCAEPGFSIWYSESNNEKRKYPFSWELSQTTLGDYICVNTLRANQLIIEALNNQIITELQGFNELTTEVTYGEEKSRIDVLLKFPNKADHYIEVKSVTLLAGDQGYFPDAKTTRGQKHLRELMAMQAQGFQSVLLFAVLHTGINSVSPASHIDPKYAELLSEAVAQGVKVIAYKANISPTSMTINEKIPVNLIY